MAKPKKFKGNPKQWAASELRQLRSARVELRKAEDSPSANREEYARNNYARRFAIAQRACAEAGVPFPDSIERPRRLDGKEPGGEV